MKNHLSLILACTLIQLSKVATTQDEDKGNVINATTEFKKEKSECQAITRILPLADIATLQGLSLMKIMLMRSFR